MRSRVLLAVSFVLLAVSVSGCQPVQAAFTPKKKVVTVEATVAAEGAAVEGELPEGLPENLPLWPGATVADSQLADDGSITLVLDTADPFDDVLKGVVVGLERSGWQAVQSLEEDSATALDVSVEGYQGIVTVLKGEGSTAIEYFIVPAEK